VLRLDQPVLLDLLIPLNILICLLSAIFQATASDPAAELAGIVPVIRTYSTDPANNTKNIINKQSSYIYLRRALSNIIGTFPFQLHDMWPL
jgi:hypothetical protein